MFSFPSTVLPAINALANLLFSLRSGWTCEQREAVVLVSKLASQQKVANYLGISPAAVNQRLRGANYSLYLEGKEALGQLLERELSAFAAIPK
jgi:DNA-binding CsgD family transcriptional regulator